MTKQFVRIGFDVSTQYEGFPPRYRVFVNGELFSERPYYALPHELYQEILQINAEAGEYTVQFEPLNGAEFEVGPVKVLFGPAAAIEKNKFRILSHK